MQTRVRPALLLVILAVLTLLAFCVALAVGSVPRPPGKVIAALAGGGDALTRTLVLELRLPRAVTAFSVGGLLALAGALMQVLLRNPLADPYILGVSGGAAVGALLSLLLGLAGYWVSGSAFIGALISMLIVFVLAHGRGGWTPTRLLLTGIVVAFGWSAAISLLLVLSDNASLRGMLFWLMGDLAYRSSGWLALIVLAAGLVVCLPFARHLNVLARGETLAEALGVAVRPFSIAIYIAASLFTAVAVTEAGAIGFVGLVIPHLLRLVSGSDHRLLLPGAVLAGGSLLMLADTLARTVIAPEQLPAGVVTAAIGVPVFLYLLNRARGPL
ncbi:MAG: iron ABC transporter permease [Gammaproteobacteria bacterium]|nr:iron ABC transporter permease [Gammaproteobacteria bacterium]MBU6509238.1 iron ABC transporter permease [Gammaproteobacteria bacterium]MDE1983760.1 iron ABC transporter permease [Gammaproteobacteria bacterium]MDE2107882.1 iron ABC transporter permease [Gammaproteobacteria bacterium]